MELAGLKGRERLNGYDVASVIRYDGKKGCAVCADPEGQVGGYDRD